MIIRPGAAFTSAADGDIKDPTTRAAVSDELGVSPEWAEVHQVHGGDVVVVDRPGHHGDADALATVVPRLPLLVRTADCLGVVLRGDGGVAVAHAGWRGAAAGIVPAAADALRSLGVVVTRAYLGPFIGPCCFEVGPEVVAEFPNAVAATTWGTTSIDLGAVIGAHLPDVDVEPTAGCTMCGSQWFSHRANGTVMRQGAIGWIP